ncbi:type III secretion system gatekeeper subunit SctW [Motiliproteus sp. MSK22-1]|uniref:type III secretion system gatekeeper subunit SctW n=1 Tax=Motiliproteus sp. MSK22-1 TaxID=1897630 RepID=UPI000977639C|nr:type III secretion system gatekeeper subunit SctW [Motiliproteus sp. MSK22-1]OMH25640.1 SepL/TyeA/HrpJ family type III secretion system gatekeeper [Motiliproteus sp. MSK22-1]
MSSHSIQDSHSTQIGRGAIPLNVPNQISQTNAPSLPSFTDASEELAMQFSSKAEQGKSLKERISSNSNRRVEEAKKWMQLLDGSRPQAIDALSKRAQQELARGGGTKALLDICNGDPARAALVLQHGQKLASQEGRPDDKQRMVECEKNLIREYGPQINGGLNTAKALIKYTQDPSLLQQLRNVYYKSIIKKRSLSNLCASLVDLLGEDGLMAGLRTMQRALADDLKSAQPSINSTPQLQALVSDLGMSQKLAGVVTESRHLLERMRKKVMLQQMTPLELTRRIIAMTTSQLYIGELRRLNEDTVGQKRPDRLLFMNALLPVIKRLPIALWADTKHRSSAITSMLRYMDDETAKEIPSPVKNASLGHHGSALWK